jgi:hypothetical protein
VTFSFGPQSPVTSKGPPLLFLTIPGPLSLLPLRGLALFAYGCNIILLYVFSQPSRAQVHVLVGPCQQARGFIAFATVVLLVAG